MYLPVCRFENRKFPCVSIFFEASTLRRVAPLSMTLTFYARDRLTLLVNDLAFDGASHFEVTGSPASQLYSRVFRR
jgi:hypothetical protein